MDDKHLSKFIGSFTKTETCWIWTKTKLSYGYGSFSINRKTYLAHRISYQIHKGEIPAGLVVRHSCDNPPCVNPEHLILGTHQDNVADRVARGRTASGDKNGARTRPDRMPRGKDNGMSKLTPEIVLKMRSMYKPYKFGAKKIADIFGVNPSTAYFAITGKNWAHV